MNTTRYRLHRIYWTLSLGALALPQVVFAQIGLPSSSQGSRGGAAQLDNPLGKVKTIQGLIELIIRLALQIGIPIAVLMIMYSGYLFVTARGDMKKIELARDNFFYTVIGTAILLGAFVITRILQGTIDSLGVK